MAENFEIPHEYVANRAPMDSVKQRCVVCEETVDHAYHAEVKDLAEPEPVVRPMPQSDWHGDSPFWLLCKKPEGGNIGIDVDETGWVEDNKQHMREPGTWLLMDKRTGRPIFVVTLAEGDQFYFAKRHVGDLMRGKEVLCYGIGKKKADGVPVNLWLLPNGMVCGGDDVDDLAARML